MKTKKTNMRKFLCIKLNNKKLLFRTQVGIKVTVTLDAFVHDTLAKMDRHKIRAEGTNDKGTFSYHEGCYNTYKKTIGEICCRFMADSRDEHKLYGQLNKMGISKPITVN